MDKTICECPQTIAMASVPKQEWCEPYSWEQALCEGTIFPCLNLVFYKAPNCEGKKKGCCEPISAQEHLRECMMKEIYEIGFAINDLTLYLDTHPDCPNGTPLLFELLKKRMELLAQFAKKFYPLTAISMVTGECDNSKYGWAEGPMPWEGACI